jgi:hypothetical protein
VGVAGPSGGKDAAWVDVAGGGPLGRRALFGLGENDEGGRAPPQADWRLDKVLLILAEEVERVRGGKPGRRRIVAGKALLGRLWLSDSRSHVIDECIRKDNRREN